jgi:hypothetical protein
VKPLVLLVEPIEVRDALAKLMVAEGVDANAADKAAEVVNANFDLMPPGTTLLLKESLGRAIKGEQD